MAIRRHRLKRFLLNHTVSVATCFNLLRQRLELAVSHLLLGNATPSLAHPFVLKIDTEIVHAKQKRKTCFETNPVPTRVITRALEQGPRPKSRG